MSFCVWSSKCSCLVSKDVPQAFEVLCEEKGEADETAVKHYTSETVLYNYFSQMNHTLEDLKNV